MKEFENDNWELKARQLADAFQPTPDDSVWLNVEATLKQKKRRGFFFLLFSAIGVAGLVYGGVTLYLLNAGDKYASFQNNVEGKVESTTQKNISIEIKSPSVTVAENSVFEKAQVTASNKLANKEKGVSKNISSSTNLNTVINENQSMGIPEVIVSEPSLNTSVANLKALPLLFSSLNFSENISSPDKISVSQTDYVNKIHRWMLLASTSYMNQHSVLQSIDSFKTFQKQDANYFDGSLNLIYQFPKAKNLELNFGIGFYEMSQNYAESKYLVFTTYDTTTGAPLALHDKLIDTESGSEFFRNGYLDFGIGLPIISGKKFSWNLNSGVRTEYLLKYSTTSSIATVPNTFSNAVYSIEAISQNTVNRIYLKGILNSSLRYSLSQKLGLQTGINSSYSLTDRYKKSGSLHQHDLNYGINLGLLYRF